MCNFSITYCRQKMLCYGISQKIFLKCNYWTLSPPIKNIAKDIGDTLASSLSCTSTVTAALPIVHVSFLCLSSLYWRVSTDFYCIIQTPNSNARDITINWDSQTFILIAPIEVLVLRGEGGLYSKIPRSNVQIEYIGL